MTSPDYTSTFYDAQRHLKDINITSINNLLKLDCTAVDYNTQCQSLHTEYVLALKELYEKTEPKDWIQLLNTRPCPLIDDNVNQISLGVYALVTPGCEALAQSLCKEGYIPVNSDTFKTQFQKAASVEDNEIETLFRTPEMISVMNELYPTEPVQTALPMVPLAPTTTVEDASPRSDTPRP